LDASGKSTQALQLSAFLLRRGKTVCLRSHPSGDNLFGLKTKQFLYCSGKSAHFASAFFYMADVIRSILLYSWQKYDYLIFVRYLIGTAYLPSPLHSIAYRFFALVVPKPEAMFFLDLTPDEARKRIVDARKDHEVFEQIYELKKVRAKGLSLAIIDNWTIIRADRPIAEVGIDLRRILGYPDKF
jgi:dTMP kinase